jgi:hypothetical protein
MMDKHYENTKSTCECKFFINRVNEGEKLIYMLKPKQS